MKAVIYARYSSDSQREESIEGQLRECTAFAEKNGITVLRHYIDRAYSAKTDNRPEFQSMIKDSGKRLFDIVIVWKLDRFARNRYDSARYKATLKKNGVKVVSATEIISEGAEGIILESVLEGYAEYYSADLSEKVIRGMTDNALKCKFNGGSLPIGYVIDDEQHFKIDPLTAPFVLEAFKRYDGGETISSIMNWLNEQGLTNTRGQKMTFNSVGHILHNRRYIGEFRYRDVIVPDGIPAIVPQDLFDRVQEKLAKNKKAPARHKAEDDYLLTTKLFYGYCGAYLCGESGTSRTGKVHHYYKCVSVKKKRTECHKKPVRKEWIEDLVVGETMKMVMDDKAIEAIVSMLMDLQDRDNVNVPLYEQQLREAETAISNLLNAIQQGILTRSTKERLEELENRRDERVDSMEPTLAHVIPEMSSNAAVALATLVYLFVLDWRMALAALATLPLGMVFFALMMAGYDKNYARTVAATNALNDAAVEYIGGIEVIKVFGKAKSSYKRFSAAARECA